MILVQERQPSGLATWRRQFTLEDVDVGTWADRLERLGLELPFEIDGNVSVEAEVRFPIGALTDLGAYYAEGTLRSNQLQIAGFELRDLSAAFVYDQGLLRLTEVEFRIPGVGLLAPSGTITGSAEAQLMPRGPLTAKLSLDSIPISRIVDLIPGFAGTVSGNLSGDLTLQVPLERIQQISAWEIEGKLAATALRAFGITVDQASAAVQVQEGVLQVAGLVAELAGMRVRGTGELRLTAPYPYAAVVQITDGTFEKLRDLLQERLPPLDAEGRFSVSITSRGTLQPLTAAVSGSAALEEATFGDLSVERAVFSYAIEQGNLVLRDLDVALYGGRATGSAVVPLFAPEQPLRFQVRWQGIQLGQLLADLSDEPVPVAGPSSGVARGQVPVAQLDDLTAWTVEGSTTLVDAQLLGAPFARVDTGWRLQEGILSLSNFRAQRGPMTVAGAIRIRITEPNAYSAALRITDGQLAELVGLLAEEPPTVPITGRYSMTVRLQGTTDPFQITARGSASVGNAAIGPLDIDAATFDFVADPRQLLLSNLNASLYGGRAVGTVTVPLEEAAAGQAQLRWGGVAFQRALQGLFGISLPIQATAYGSANLQLPAGALQDVASLQGEATLSLRNATGLGLNDASLDANLQFQDEILTISRLAANLQPGRLAASARVRLTAPFPFAAAARIENGTLATLNDLPTEIRPPFPLAGRFNLSTRLQGALEPREVTGTGSFAAAELRFGDAEIDSLVTDFQLSDQRLSLENIRANLYEGAATGSAVIPITDAVGGEIRLQWRNVDAGDLVNDLLELPVRLEGPVNVDLVASAPPGQFGNLAAWTIDGSFTAPAILANSVPVGSLQGQIQATADTIAYQLAGSLLAGAVRLEGRWSPEVPDVAARDGILSLRGLQLERIARVIQQSPAATDWAGTLDLELRYEHLGKFGPLRGTGSFELNNVRWQTITLADALRGAIQVEPGRVELANVGGALAGGYLRAAVLLDFEQPSRSNFFITLLGAELSRLLAPWPDVADSIEGRLDLRLQGNLDRPWRATGTIALPEVTLFGITLRGVQLPLTALFDPLSGYARLDIRGVRATIAQGRLTGDLTLIWTYGLTVDGELMFFDVGVQSLMRQTTSFAQLGTGRISGQATIEGRNVRSASDLTGTLRAQLRNTQALYFPILRQIQPYLAGGLAISTSFNQGELSARLSRGIVFVQEFWLASDSTRLWGEGTVSLRGILDLDVALQTGPVVTICGIAPGVLAQIPAFGSIPVALLQRINQFLANRIIYLEITGTIRNPIVRVRPLPLLGQEAVRFFLGESLLLGDAAEPPLGF